MSELLRDQIKDLADMLETSRTGPEDSWPSTYRLLAEEGHLWHGSHLPANMSRGAAKACYQNSWKRAQASSHLVYCEGLALDAAIPLPLAHAWLLDTRTGKVIETTWKAGPEITYLGLAIPNQLVKEGLERSARMQVVSILEGDWARSGWFHRKETAQQAIDYTHALTGPVQEAVKARRPARRGAGKAAKGI